MDRLEFSIDIEAPRERVWEVLWSDETFGDWTSAFTDGSPGSSISCDWREGGRFEFFEGDIGSYGVLDRLVPAHVVVFHHLGEIEGGQEHPYDDGGRREVYVLEQTGDVTTLTLAQEVPGQHRAMFEEAIPQALQRLKALLQD